jgi:hypothetical protein
MQSVAMLGRLCRATARSAPRLAASTKNCSISSQTSTRSVVSAASAALWRSVQSRKYSATAQTASTASSVVSELPVKVETISTTLPEEQITQQSMLVPLADLVAIPDSFAVVQIGGKQVRDDHIFSESNLVATFVSLNRTPAFAGQFFLLRLDLFGRRQNFFSAPGGPGRSEMR